MTMLPVTLVLAAGCALINLWLSIRIGAVRRVAQVFVGDGGDERVICRMRAQANFVENAPFVVALVLAIEIAAGTSGWLWAAALAFLIARIAHPFGMDGWRPGRMIGTLVTMLALLALAIWAIMLASGYRAQAGTPAPTVDVAVSRS